MSGKKQAVATGNDKAPEPEGQGEKRKRGRPRKPPSDKVSMWTRVSPAGNAVTGAMRP